MPVVETVPKIKRNINHSNEMKSSAYIEQQNDRLLAAKVSFCQHLYCIYHSILEKKGNISFGFKRGDTNY